MKSIKFSLVTPERKLLEEEVLQVTLPTEAGEVTILPDHIPYIATLKSGEARVETVRGESQHFVVLGGFVEFHDNALSVLADAAERADEIDLERARVAEERAREIREKKIDVSAEEQEVAVAALERAWARLHVAKKHRSHRSVNPETSV
ncbi:MAG: ATP synthase F1 subunit epsilon [Candidatus Moraniibacteriota bacterium]|nr:MAG: ATP synthase F1 subunit epsilon [Candidatus Moranbacteria bacterium]